MQKLTNGCKFIKLTSREEPKLSVCVLESLNQYATLRASTLKVDVGPGFNVWRICVLRGLGIFG